VAETCGQCHANAAYMASYEIPTDQLDAYRRSVHYEMLTEAGDLSAPTCNDCHGNHGAAPPGLSWVGNVCGQCHAVQADYFRLSKHSRTFTALGLPGCATCHSNHEIRRASDAMLGLDSTAVCSNCHGPGDPGGQAAVTLRTLIDSLRIAFEEAEGLLEQAENAGMEVSQAQVDLQGAHSALVSARAAVHAFTPDSVAAHVDEGLTVASDVRGRGRKALRDLQFRRTGLAVSVGIILILIIGLVLKIRELDARRAAPSEGGSHD